MSPTRGGRLREMVATGGSTVVLKMYVAYETSSSVLKYVVQKTKFINAVCHIFLIKLGLGLFFAKTLDQL